MWGAMSAIRSMWRKPAAGRPTTQGVVRIPPNTSSIAFGLAGLSDVWRAAAAVIGVPVTVADVLLIVAAAVWLAQVVAYLAQGPRRLALDWRDPVLSPFISLMVITPLLLAAGLSLTAFAAARVLVIIFLILTTVVGGIMTGQWIAESLDSDRMHPGYFLPTVAGGFIGAYAAATVHLHALAEASFGLGLICWLVLGSNIQYRLFFRGALPAALVPTLAIEMAPPVVAGFSWFAVTGGSTGLVSRFLAGYAILMALVQVRFIPLYARLKFSIGFWAFTFSYAATATDAMLWLRFARAPGARAWGTLVLILITLMITAIAVRTVVAIARGQFFPRTQVPEQ
jgi:tellurite resistance protein